MARKTGQIIRRESSTWLVGIYVGRDPESEKRKYVPFAFFSLVLSRAARSGALRRTFRQPRRMPEVVMPNSMHSSIAHQICWIHKTDSVRLSGKPSMNLHHELSALRMTVSPWSASLPSLIIKSRNFSTAMRISSLTLAKPSNRQAEVATSFWARPKLSPTDFSIAALISSGAIKSSLLNWAGTSVRSRTTRLKDSSAHRKPSR